MNIDGLLDFYRKVSLKDEKVRLSSRYLRGPTSLASVISELLHNHINISPYNMYLIVGYGIVSELHPQESPKWKSEKTKEVFGAANNITKDNLLAQLERKSA